MENDIKIVINNSSTPDLEIKKTSDEWMKIDEFKNIKIIDPDGWDRSSRENYRNTFYRELITKQEFWERLFKSTIEIKYFYTGKVVYGNNSNNK